MKPIVLLTAAMALASCTTPGTGGSGVSASSGGGSGRYCASYSGSKGSSGSGAQGVIRDRRCFATLAACRRWFYDVQTAAPKVFSSRRCGR